MPKPIRFTYEKKAPFRDAFYFIIVCEGNNSEPDYFRFFDGMSSRVKIVPVESGSASALKLLIDKAFAIEEELDAKAEKDRVWFVIDTDDGGNNYMKSDKNANNILIGKLPKAILVLKYGCIFMRRHRFQIWQI